MIIDLMEIALYTFFVMVIAWNEVPQPRVVYEMYDKVKAYLNDKWDDFKFKYCS